MMKYDDSDSLQYSLVKEYIDRMFSKDKIVFPAAYFYPLQLSGSPKPDRIIQYHRKFINFLGISVVYYLLSQDLRQIFELKFIKKLPSSNIAYRLQLSETFIFPKVNKIYKNIISLLNYNLQDEDILDSRKILNLINLLDMRISILVRYKLTHYEHFDRLCRLRNMYSRFYAGYVDLYNKPEEDPVSSVIMLRDFDRELSVAFLAEKLSYSSPFIYQSLNKAKKKLKKIIV